MNPLNCRPP